MDPLIVTAMAYVVMASDDRRTIVMREPLSLVMLADAAAYEEKFCTTIANAAETFAIKLRSAAPIGKIGKIHEVEIWPMEKLTLELSGGIWSLKDHCDPRK